MRLFTFHTILSRKADINFNLKLIYVYFNLKPPEKFTLHFSSESFSFDDSLKNS